MNRRVLFGALTAAGLTALSGCLSFAGLTEHEASPVAASASARTETGYRVANIETMTYEDDVDLFVTSETVRVDNYVVEHEKTLSAGPVTDEPAAVFYTLSTPAATVAGHEINPLTKIPTNELVQVAAESDAQFQHTRRLADEQTTVHDQSTEETIFSAEGRFGSELIDVRLHVTEAVDVGDDLVITIGAYPATLEDEERANVETLRESLSTDVDPDKLDDEED